MANAFWLGEITKAAKSAHRALNLLVDVELHRRGTTRSAVTGNREYLAPVTVKAKIQTYGLHLITGERTISTAKHRVGLYEVQAAEGDKIEWDGEEHEILRVQGLVSDTDGTARYMVRAEVD